MENTEVEFITKEKLNLSVTEGESIRGRVKFLVEEINNGYMELGELLYKVKYGELFARWNYPSFEEYCKTELGYQKRKSLYLISVWKTFGMDLGVTNVEELGGIGWTKARQIAPVVNKENLQSWVEKAKNSTIGELTNEVKKSIDPISESIYRETFSLFSEQRDILKQSLALAGQLGNTDKPGRQLELICLSFLASSSTGNDYFKSILSNIERSYGVNLMASKNGTIVYGSS